MGEDSGEDKGVEGICDIGDESFVTVGWDWESEISSCSTVWGKNYVEDEIALDSPETRMWYWRKINSKLE